VDNDFHEKFSTREMLASVAAATPAGRLGTNEEMADAIVLLCSDRSRYIYGQTVELNGGMYMVGIEERLEIFVTWAGPVELYMNDANSI
jgi:3-oxoacyl-[acyl-carrier protein] reductase